MKHIHTRICPLCSKKLKTFWNGHSKNVFCQDIYFRNESDWTQRVTYHKPEKANGYKVPEPHYSVVYIDDYFIQSAIIPPYWIRSDSKVGTSKIYRFPFKQDFSYPPVPDKNLIMEVPIIEPSNYTREQFVQKIKNLVIFT